MAGPLISVLIPCCNAAPWLAKALRSALEQTWSRVEIILVDDGSTDGSYALARTFASFRCQVVRQERAGASAARNLALSLAQGEFIQYLDADDFLDVEKLELQMVALRDAPADGLSFGSLIDFHDPWEHHKGSLHSASWLPKQGAEPVDFLSHLWSGRGAEEMVQTGQWLVPRGLIERAGAWDESLSVDDDGEFFARVVLAASRIFGVPEARSYYRRFRTTKNLSATRQQESSLRAAELKSGYLLDRSSSEESRQAVRRLITREIVSAYPQFPQLVDRGSKFLAHRDLEMEWQLEGSPWFLRLYPRIGWRTARVLQHHFDAWRRLTSQALDLLPYEPPRAGDYPHHSEHRPAAGRCNPRPATDHPHA